jgi:calcineurin-like phosphoesterase family protein
MRHFISDPHFATESIIRNMGRCIPDTSILFINAEEHDDYMLDAINSTVAKEDELFILGDFSKEKPGKYRARINCRHVHLVLGNHDSRAKCENVFGPCQHQLVTKLRCGDKSLRCVLSHVPQAYWIGSHLGHAHLYGHTHGHREETLDDAFPDRRSLDVTVDNIYNLTGSYEPVSEELLYEYFMETAGHDQVSFYDAIKENRDKSLGLI